MEFHRLISTCSFSYATDPIHSEQGLILLENHDMFQTFGSGCLERNTIIEMKLDSE